jgi:hypothetical protein
MKNLVFVAVLLLVGIAGVGLYRGWFHLSTNGAGHEPSATVTVDKDKLHADEQRAKDKVQRLEQEAKKKIGDWEGKAKEPQPQP